MAHSRSAASAASDAAEAVRSASAAARSASRARRSKAAVADRFATWVPLLERGGEVKDKTFVVVGVVKSASASLAVMLFVSSARFFFSASSERSLSRSARARSLSRTRIFATRSLAVAARARVFS